MPEFATDAAADVAAEEDSLINLVTDENIAFFWCSIPETEREAEVRG